MKYAVIDDLTKKVENVIEADSLLKIRGKTLIQDDTADIGESFDGVKIVKTTIKPYIPTAKEEIEVLEMEQTPRRLREAALGIDSGWLLDLDNKIKAKRALLV